MARYEEMTAHERQPPPDPQEVDDWRWDTEEIRDFHRALEARQTLLTPSHQSVVDSVRVGPAGGGRTAVGHEADPRLPWSRPVGALFLVSSKGGEACLSPVNACHHVRLATIDTANKHTRSLRRSATPTAPWRCRPAAPLSRPSFHDSSTAVLRAPAQLWAALTPGLLSWVRMLSWWCLLPFAPFEIKPTTSYKKYWV